MQAARDNDRDDDTAADRMLAAMRESSARLNGIIQSAIDAIITVDDRQAIVIFNPAAEKMFGCAASEAMGTPLEQFIPARFREAHRRHINRFGATGVTTRRMGANSEITGLRANGEEFPLEAAISQVVVGGKKLFSVILRDIGERKQTERALKDSAERYQRLVELIPDPIWIEREGCITFANPACAQLLGATSPAQIIGKSPLAFIHPELHALTAARRAHLSAGGVVNPLIEKQLVRLNAEVRDVEMTETSFHEEGKLVIVAVVRDVTERKRVQRDLQESGAQLRRLSASLQAVREEEKARIARELHDELGQALTGLKMDLAQLQVQLQPQQAEAIKRADAMKRLLDHTVASVRRIATELRPLMLDDLGLLPALEWQAQSYATIVRSMQTPQPHLLYYFAVRLPKLWPETNLAA